MNLTGRESAKGFAAKWLSSNAPRVPIGEPVRIDGATVELLFRQGQYQVERCTIDPDTEIPDHVHPHIDSVEYFVGGASRFRIAQWSGVPTPGETVRIRPGIVHGASVGHTGVVFLSLQHWIGIPPSHVTDDWQGATMGDTHKQRIG